MNLQTGFQVTKLYEAVHMVSVEVGWSLIVMLWSQLAWPHVHIFP